MEREPDKLGRVAQKSTNSNGSAKVSLGNMEFPPGTVQRVTSRNYGSYHRAATSVLFT
jgi:hypothetical protein